MLKYAALLFNSLALLIYQFFFADTITITQNIPASAKAGTEFVVELTINKGATSGFAKLQQDLPDGFTAVDKSDNNGGSFTFTNQSVKLIWMSLPSEKEFKVRYTVKVPQGMNGDRVIGGKFSYVAENVKQTVDVTPATIKIISDAPAVAETTPPATTEQPVTTPTATTTPTLAVTTPAVANLSGNEGLSVNCTRKVPTNVGSEFTVELNINKGNLSGFAKLLETLPAGFTAVSGESKGASFSFSDQKVKFVWVSMPSETEFKVSYKVTVSAEQGSVHAIDGVFSYIENDETKKFTIPTSPIGVGPNAVVNPPLAVTETKKEETPVAIVEKKEEPAVAVDNLSSKTSGVNVVPETPTTVNTPTVTPTQDNTRVLSATNVPIPQGDVNYRVQIAALHRAVEASVLATRYNLYEPVITEMAQGFTKYTVGSHKEYKSAHDARETMKNKGVVGPFVTAYNTGKRITVQEALMITSQKWFR